MTLDICYTILTMSRVGQFKCNISDVPIFISDLFEQFYPHVRHSHGQSEIEANATLLDRSAETRKS